MIALVFTVCLAAQPRECEERSIAYLEPLSPMACLMQAQPELARWAEAHPVWRVRRWSCRSGLVQEVKA